MPRPFGRASRREPTPAPRSPLPADLVAGAPPALPADGPHPLLGGRYRLDRLLGKGGEASVYAALDEQLGRTVAVKLFHRRLAPPSRGTLEQAEARVAASLNHYALTTMLDSGIGEGPDGGPQLYIVMEYVPGETLTARLRRRPMEPSEACWLGFDLAEGLAYMHATGFVHRDVKPSNILISAVRSVRPVIAKLTDFGIAAPVGEPDLSEFTVGTAAYLSPEQVEGRDAVPASDTYSLALVLLEAMTQRVVFPGNVTESAFARLTRDPVVPDDLPPRLAALLRRMTERSPADRIDPFSAAVELQQILVDDLTRRRGGAGASLPPAPDPISGGQGLLDPSPVADAAVRLAVAATGASRGVLLRTDRARGARIVAEHGWSSRPVAMERWPLVAVGGNGPWAVPDVLAHPTLFAHPIGASPYDMRAVAGCPVQGADGPVGVLCVLDGQPRAFAPRELQALSDAVGLLQQDLQLRAAVRRALFSEP